jgi:hypothetical protein
VHEPERSTWTSAETWRPLPRREAERAGEYDVLVGVNRHVVTPQGWDHEQDNRKLVLSDARSVARERGLNRYVRSDFGADARIVRAYLDEIGPFWADVRVAWEQRLRDRDRIVVLDVVPDALPPRAQRDRARSREAAGGDRDRARSVPLGERAGARGLRERLIAGAGAGAIPPQRYAVRDRTAVSHALHRSARARQLARDVPRASARGLHGGVVALGTADLRRCIRPAHHGG